MLSVLLTEDDAEIKNYGLIWDTIPIPAWMVKGKQQNTLVMTASHWSKIWDQDLSNMKDEYCLFIHSHQEHKCYVSL